MSERLQPQQIRVFLSSPGDVTDERALARHLLKDELPYEPLLPRGYVTFDVVSWDDPAAPTPTPAGVTPQEAVNRFGPKPSECDVLVVILWSRLGTHLDLNAFRKADNRPYLSGTEWEFEDAFNAPEPRRPTILVYRRTEEPRVGLKDAAGATEAIRQYGLVETFLKRFKNPDRSFRGGFMPYGTPTEFKERLGNDLKYLLRERLFREPIGTSHAAPSVIAAPAWTGSPYPGLRPFTGEEASIFFGRGREVDALIVRLRDPAQRFLAVAGASGAGKSSLVRAGLLPRLADDALEGSQHWRVLAFTPGAAGGDPFLAMASELKGMLQAAEQKPQIEIARVLAETPQSFGDYADKLLAGRPAGTALVLFADQLEELFTLAAEKQQGAFAELLARAANDPRLRVLATLRADFLPQCAAEPNLAALLQAGTFVLGPPGPVALADMIRRPAERAGLKLDEDLADAILRDVGSDPGEALPLVAFCLEELYRRAAPQQHQHLTLDAYRAMGRLRGAIGRRADELLEGFREVDRADLDAALPRLFRALVHVDAAGKVIRQRASRDELMATPLPIPQLVKGLTDPGRLLLAEGTGGRATVTLAHEALLQEWPALRDWLERDRPWMQRLESQLLNLAAHEAEDRQYAAQALGEMASVPHVMPAEAQDWQHVARAALAVPKVVPALNGALRDHDGRVRRAAAEALGRIGPAAAEAVPALVIALDDTDAYVRHVSLFGQSLPTVRTVVAEALGRIGPEAAEAVPALIGALRDANGLTRQAAAEALGRIGPEAAEAVPALIGALSDDGGQIRQAAAEALGRIGPEAAEAVPALNGALRDHDGRVRRVAAEALGRIGPAAVPALIGALRDADGQVRRAGAQVLGRIGPAAVEAVPSLIGALRDADRHVRWAAAQVLGRIGLAAPAVVPALITALGDAEKDVSSAAAEALGRIGPAAPEVVPALITTLRDADPEIRWAAANVLWKIGPAAAEAVPALITALGDAGWLVRRVAAYALRQIGPAAAEAVPRLITALGDAEVGVRRAAAEALGQIGPAAEVVPALITTLADTEEDVRRVAADALRQIGPAAAEAVPALITTLGDTEEGVRRVAADALGQIGLAAAEAVPALITALGDTEEDVHTAAAKALGQIGRVAPEVVPALITALSNAEEDVRRAAAFALGQIGPAAAEAVPALITALDDTEEDVHTAAAEALGRIRSRSATA